METRWKGTQELEECEGGWRQDGRAHRSWKNVREGGDKMEGHTGVGRVGRKNVREGGDKMEGHTEVGRCQRRSVTTQKTDSLENIFTDIQGIPVIAWGVGGPVVGRFES